MTTYAWDREAFCWGCRTCEVACKQENKAADGVKLISVTEDGPAAGGKARFQLPGHPLPALR